MTSNDKTKAFLGEDPMTESALDLVSNIMNIDRDDSSRVLRNMWLLVHGIATLEATEKMNFSEEELSDILSTTFSALKTQMEVENK